MSLFDDVINNLHLKTHKNTVSLKEIAESLQEINKEMRTLNDRLDCMDSKFRAIRQNDLSRDPIE